MIISFSYKIVCLGCNEQTLYLIKKSPLQSVCMTKLETKRTQIKGFYFGWGDGVNCKLDDQIYYLI